MAKAPPLISFLLFSAAVLLTFPAAISSIGVNYGTLGNLPPPTQVANFLKTQTSIDSVKIFNVDPNILRAFAGTGISVVVTVPNGDIPALANGMQARRWVSANILPFHPQTKIKYISVGNEILLTGDNNTISKLLPAMRTINSALVRAGVRDVKVTTAHSLNIIAYDLHGAPSRGRFRPVWEKSILAPILAFHRQTKSPFMVNPYPYFGFDPKNVNFAIFRSPYKAVRDPFTRKIYTNMYDALMDSTYSAMKALGYGDVNIVVGETGWPSACDAPWCSPANAAWFNLNIIRRAQGQGTPLMPKRRFETYIFGLFNEEANPVQPLSGTGGFSGLIFLRFMTLVSSVVVAVDVQHQHCQRLVLLVVNGAWLSQEPLMRSCKRILIGCVVREALTVNRSKPVARALTLVV